MCKGLIGNYLVIEMICVLVDLIPWAFLIFQFIFLDCIEDGTATTLVLLLNTDIALSRQLDVGINMLL